MTGQFFFTTIAGLALSVAGFASLVMALRPSGRWSKTSLWRLRGIVGQSLMITVVAVLPLPVYYAVTADEPLTIRIMSLVIALILLVRLWRALGEREWGLRFVIQAGIILGIQVAAQLANVGLASLPLLMFGLLAWLAFPIQLLFRIITDFQPPLDGD